MFSPHIQSRHMMSVGNFLALCLRDDKESTERGPGVEGLLRKTTGVKNPK